MCLGLLVFKGVFLFGAKAASVIHPKEVPPEAILLAVYLELQNGECPPRPACLPSQHPTLPRRPELPVHLPRTWCLPGASPQQGKQGSLGSLQLPVGEGSQF